MNIHLLLFQILYSIDILLSIFIIFFLFFKAKKDAARIMLIVTFFGVIIFVLSQMLGVSTHNSYLSYIILSFKMVVLFLPIFAAHCVFATLDKLKEQTKPLILFYTMGIGILLYYIFVPGSFITISEPKMYLPNYYVPGPYCWVLFAFMLFVLIYFLLFMIRTYKTTNDINKNKIKYFAIALFFGFTVGMADLPLIYNIKFDPIWEFLFVPLFTIPFMYATMKYKLMDVKIIAKKAYIYGLIGAAICAVLVFGNYLNNIISQNSPGFPNWASSLVLAVILTIGIIFILKKIKEEDILKYEFINVVIHKFRTPLTSIRWSTENIIKSTSNSNEDAIRIQKSTDSLVDLTNLLVNLSLTEDNTDTFEYKIVKIDLNSFVKNLVSNYSEELKLKNIELKLNLDSTKTILSDEQKLKFIFQTLIDNAIRYTNQNGSISICISEDKDNVITKIADSGIGINPDEMGLIFTKFYRTERSKRADTEGMGIGLYLVKQILEKLHGKIWLESDGENKGSSFFVSLERNKE